jgi:uncharacterized membrane protein YdjX (TVP38/TMEM64 family)
MFPFFVVNVGMGLTRLPSWTYTWVTYVGIIPATFVVVSAGAEVGEVTSFRELASFRRLWPLLALVLLAVALRVAAGRYLRRRADSPFPPREGG